VEIELPEEVSYIINAFEKNNFEAYAVGGCVRDAVLGKTPKDWDICTNATPRQTKLCFAGQRIIETGIKHGTITLVLSDDSYEVTTFRTDGIYKDNRRPETVEFVSDIKNDLARRDFTINALAYHPSTGIVDYFRGISDINNRIIRCVGNADERFKEDALRIMRALRLSSILGFDIEEETADAINKNSYLLDNIASERINEELSKLLSGADAKRILFEYGLVIGQIVPEINPEKKQIKKWLGRIGEERFRQLIEIKKAYTMSNAKAFPNEEQEKFDDILKAIDDEVQQQRRLSLKALEIDGKDLLAFGIPEGIELGETLNRLLEMVVEGNLENDRQKLLLKAKELRDK